MGKSIFANIDTYIELYEYVAQQPRTRNETEKYLIVQKQKNENTAKVHVRNAVSGDLECIEFKDEKLCFDSDVFKKKISELCSRMGLLATLEAKPAKKVKPEDSIATVTDGHSPEFKKMKKLADEAEGSIKAMQSQIAAKDEEIEALKKQLEKLSADAILKAMGQKVLVMGSAKAKPEEKFQRDFFLMDKRDLLDVSDLVSKYGGVIDSPYDPVFAVEKELNEENYIRRVFKQLAKGSLFRRRLEEQERFSKVLVKEDDECKWAKRKSINKAEIERNRLESVNQILSLTEISNQVKLSLYAAWLDKDDPEMLELLDYAGEHGINADYVIRLLEKPKEFHNYRTLRGLLMQARKASEAHIKREAALELISGEWYVEADYCGKTCKFQMVPVDELERFKEVLSQYHTKEAVDILTGILSGNSRLSENEEQSAERFCMNSENAEEEAGIKPPDFLHQTEMQSGVDCHVPIDEEEVYEQFEEGDSNNGAE